MESEVPISGNDQERAYSPLVRRLAEEFDVNLEAIRGTGPGGRVTRADVQQAAFGPNLDHDHPGSMALFTETDPVDEPASPIREKVEAEIDREAEIEREATSDRDGGENATAHAHETATAYERTSQDEACDEVQVAEAMAPKPETAPVPIYTLFADVDAGPLLRAQERLSAERDEPTPLAALVVRLVAPAAELWPAVNARRVDGYEPTEEVTVALAVDGATVVLHDAARMSLIELGRRLAEEPVADDSTTTTTGTSTQPTLAVDYLIDTGVGAAAPALWADTAATLAIGHPRDEVRLLNGVPQAVATITIGLTCVTAVPAATAAKFLAEASTNLEDPLLVFAD